MHVKGLTWLGLRTHQFEEMVTFFRDVMGMKPIREEQEIVGFQLSDGTQVELYRPEEAFHAFFITGPVVAFRVEDVDAARATMEEAGIKFIGPIQRADKTSWNHFRAPDGTVFEILSRADDTQIFGDNACHPEPFASLKGKFREGSGSMDGEILRFATLRASAHALRMTALSEAKGRSRRKSYLQMSG